MDVAAGCAESNVNVIIVPGGSGARREIDNPETVEWLTQTCAKCSWVTSVCTGAFLLVGTDIVRGRRVTTHHDFVQALRDLGGAEVVQGVRFVRDGNLVSAAGVMSGIEMSLTTASTGPPLCTMSRAAWPFEAVTTSKPARRRTRAKARRTAS